MDEQKEVHARRGVGLAVNRSPDTCSPVDRARGHDAQRPKQTHEVPLHGIPRYVKRADRAHPRRQREAERFQGLESSCQWGRGLRQAMTTFWKSQSPVNVLRTPDVQRGDRSGV